MTTTTKSPAPYPTSYRVAGRDMPVSELYSGARAEIRTVAEAAGWELVNPQDGLGTFEEYRLVSASTGRTLTYVTVSYSVRDAVLHAHTPRAGIYGQGKAQRVIEILQAEAAKRSTSKAA